MKPETDKIKIGILGGGPSAMFIYKRLVESGDANFEVAIFERKKHLGAGMPYSTEGANDEHVTNVSDNEIPTIVTSIEEWLQTAPKNILDRFNIDPNQFNEYKVLPRLLFGYYLTAQFELLQEQAMAAGIETRIHYESQVTDIIDRAEDNFVAVEINGGTIQHFDYAIICTGHNWPNKYEGVVKGYFDAPYPPSKLALQLNHRIAIKGASLTAIDAVRTLARHNGTFTKDDNGHLSFELSKGSPNFKIDMHSRSGLLPAVRFHLEDSHLNNDSLLTEDEIATHISQNKGFLSLDYVFEKNFKNTFIGKDRDFYDKIRDLSMEEFVEEMMELRERLDPFQLFKAEYIEAEKSIKRHQSVYWKEMLAVLSFAMNYPAKYLSAEDMQRLQKVLMPLISIVIAFVPQRSCIELLALHEAGVLELVSVGAESIVVPQSEGGIIYEYHDEVGNAKAAYYQTFVDCVGQPHLSYEDVPFPSLIAKKSIAPARLKYSSREAGEADMNSANKTVSQDAAGDYFLHVSGIAINDNFQVLNQYGAYNDRLFIMAVPYIGGFNPDYSGLDFCEAASEKIVNQLMASSSES